MNRRIFQFTLRVMVALVTLVAMNLPAQDLATNISVSHDYLVENWQTEEGLPRNTIVSIAQDQAGYLWLGTPYGLIRFDGVRFVTFEHDFLSALGQVGVRQVFADMTGTLWIATRKSSLLRCTMEGDTLKTEPLLVHSPIDSIAQDGRGTLWIARGNGQLLKLADGQFQPTADLSKKATGTLLFKLVPDNRGQLWFYRQDAYGRIESDGKATNDVILPKRVITLAPSHNGGMWLSTGNELRFLKPGQTSTSEVVSPMPFETYDITELYEDTTGILWIGTRNQGLFQWNGSKIQKIGEVHHAIRAIREDTEANLWVGTAGAGLFKLQPRRFQLLATPGAPNQNMHSVNGDWVVPDGGGLGRIRSNGQLRMLGRFARNHLTSVCDDGEGGAWLGTSSGRLIHFNTEGNEQRSMAIGPPGTQARILYQDSHKNLWIGCFPNRLFFLPAGEQREYINLTATNFSNFAITAIAENAAGEIWVGTMGGEVYRREGDGNHFITYGTDAGLPGSPIGALLFSQDGALWIGTLGSGLGRIPKDGSKFIPTPPEICDNVISQLIEDNRGWLWVGSSRGIYRLRLSELQAVMDGKGSFVASVHFGKTDGLASVECMAGYQPSVWKSASGELRFATSKGIAVIDSEILPFNRQPPPLHLESVLVDGNAISNQANIRLPHQFKKIEFHYAALSFTSPDKVQFRRQLIGFDDNWVDDGTARSASYPRLPPGRYQFRFTACNNDSLWNEKPVIFSFEVKRAIWQTTWFQGGGLLVFAGLVGAVSRYVSMVRMRRQMQRLEQAHALDQERVRIARDLHDDLGARLTQMAFVTNLAATEPGAPTEMKIQLREVSEQARMATRSLDETVWMVDPRKDSLPQLAAYISQYANEFFQHTTVDCRQQIGINLPEYPLSSELRHHIFYTVKEILNNVLKHAEATEVWLRIGVRASLLRIVIRDNGTGFSPSKVADNRHGLENMRRRLETINGSCILRSKPGRGTTVMLQVMLPDENKTTRMSQRRNHHSRFNDAAS